MKKGDIVVIHDGSYSMMQENGCLYACSGTVLIAEGEFKVVATKPFLRSFPVSQPFYGGRKQVNNLKLQSLKTPDRFVYIQSRFCNKVR